MQSWLHKRSDGKIAAGRSVGNAFAKWDKRWFVIEAGSARLYYYKDPNDPKRGVPPSGTVDLLDATINRALMADDLTFAVHTPQRVLTLKASSFDEQLQWCEVLTSVSQGLSVDGSMKLPTPPPGLTKGTSTTAALKPERLRGVFQNTPDPAPLPLPASMTRNASRITAGGSFQHRQEPVGVSFKDEPSQLSLPSEPPPDRAAQGGVSSIFVGQAGKPAAVSGGEAIRPPPRRSVLSRDR